MLSNALHALSSWPAIWGQAVERQLARELLDGWTPKHDRGLRLTYQHIEQRLRGGKG